MYRLWYNPTQQISIHSFFFAFPLFATTFFFSYHAFRFSCRTHFWYMIFPFFFTSFSTSSFSPYFVHCMYVCIEDERTMCQSIFRNGKREKDSTNKWTCETENRTYSKTIMKTIRNTVLCMSLSQVVCVWAANVFLCQFILQYHVSLNLNKYTLHIRSQYKSVYAEPQSERRKREREREIDGEEMRGEERKGFSRNLDW